MIRKKECPSCRVPCPNKRNLRPDLRFDKIIAKIYPKNEQSTQNVGTDEVVLSNKKVIIFVSLSVTEKDFIKIG
jgi:hypothetical protein